MFTALITLRRLVESLHQLGRILTKKALAVHDAHLGMATAVQDVDGIGDQQRESVCRQQAQVIVTEQREELRKARGGTGTQSCAKWVHEYVWENWLWAYLVSQCWEQRVVSKKQSLGNLETKARPCHNGYRNNWDTCVFWWTGSQILWTKISAVVFIELQNHC